jgi:hypothetical protein
MDRVAARATFDNWECPLGDLPHASKCPGAMAESFVRTEVHRDLEGRTSHPWYRRALLALIAVIPILALFGVFGQRTDRTEASAPQATLTMSGPSRLRGGLLFQWKLQVMAHQDLAKPKLALDEGFLNGLTVNTIEPQASQELNRNGHVVLEYDTLSAGQKLTVWIQYQVNPTTVGSRTVRVELDDGNTPITSITKHVRVFP